MFEESSSWICQRRGAGAWVRKRRVSASVVFAAKASLQAKMRTYFAQPGAHLWLMHRFCVSLTIKEHQKLAAKEAEFLCLTSCCAKQQLETDRLSNEVMALSVWEPIVLFFVRLNVGQKSWFTYTKWEVGLRDIFYQESIAFLSKIWQPK